MKIDGKELPFELGDIIYIAHDEDQKRRQIIEVSKALNRGIKYTCESDEGIGIYYAGQMSKNKIV